MKPKKTRIEDTVVGAYQKIEDTVAYSGAMSAR